ncbi:v-type proton ATPase 16 kDa proteolipid subunit 2 [Rhizopus stolonifer]|uniref:V-type proton ATPase 16 kDa proteolipid subunit 2 n=1 Tax=Rhizopus stolonifer TaxID=4846 RepID=A0A367IU05_RHIST|nr:v-type proton ATPase 16 kDa proteolipid subunit 2 [Rhizopus stolonifer]
MSESSVYCPNYAPFFGFAGVFCSMAFSTIGAAYGTSKAGIGIAGIGSFKPELVMKVFFDSSCYEWYYCSIWFGSSSTLGRSM